MSIKPIAKVAIPAAAMLVPLLVLAAPVLTSPTIPGGLGNEGGCDLTCVENIISRIANFLITVSIVIAVFFIVWGAIIWMSAGDTDRAAKGRKYVWNGILGAAIVFAIGLILNTLKGVIATKFFTS